MTTPALAADIKGKGRHYTTDGNTHDHVSVTNVTGLIKDPNPLMYWAGEGVATWICDNPDGWHEQVVADPDEAIRKVKGIWKDKRDKASDDGTAIHEWLELAVSLGVDSPAAKQAEQDLTVEARRFLLAAQEFMVARQPSGMTEVTLVSDDCYAGTADLIGTINGHGGRAVIDYKTRKKHAIYDGDILQLAALRHCQQQASLNDDGTVAVWRVDPIEHAFLVTLTPDKSYRIHDLTDHTGTDAHQAFLGLRTVRVWQISSKNPSIRGMK